MPNKHLLMPVVYARAAHASPSRGACSPDTSAIASDDRARLCTHHPCLIARRSHARCAHEHALPAAKSFLVKFSESLAAELCDTGMHVCAVCRGFTRSSFTNVVGTRSVVSKFPRFMWQDARTAARDGVASVHRNETVYVTGPINQLLASAVRVLSPGLARKVMMKQAGHYRSIPPRGNPA